MSGQAPELQGQATARSMCPEDERPRLLPRPVHILPFVQQFLMRPFTVGGSGALSAGIYVGSLTTREAGGWVGGGGRVKQSICSVLSTQRSQDEEKLSGIMSLAVRKIKIDGLIGV